MTEKTAISFSGKEWVSLQKPSFYCYHVTNKLAKSEPGVSTWSISTELLSLPKY